MTAVPALLAPIRGRADKATEGPWEVIGRSVEPVIGGDEVVSTDVDCMSYCYGGTGLGIQKQADRDFIAAARMDIPRLLAALDGVLALANAWEARGEHDMAYSKTIQDEDIAMELLTNGAGMVENARHIRNAVVAALQEGE